MHRSTQHLVRQLSAIRQLEVAAMSFTRHGITMFTVAGVGAEEPILNLGRSHSSAAPKLAGSEFYELSQISETDWKLLACKRLKNCYSINKTEAHEEQKM